MTPMRIARRSLSALVALVLLVAVVVGMGTPVSLLLAFICGLIALCVRYRHKAVARTETAGSKTTGARFRDNLWAVGPLYLVPIALAAAFYILLWRYIEWYGSEFRLDSLITLQTSFETASQLFSDNMKLTEGRVLAALVLLYLLTCYLLPDRKSATDQQPDFSELRLRKRSVLALRATVEGYVKYTGPIAAGLATLASLTLFGMQLGEPSKDLQLRIKVLQEGYADITIRTEAALTKRVTEALHREIAEAMPAAYQEALILPAQIDGLVEDVRQHASRAKSRHGVTVPSVDRMVQEHVVRMEKVERLPSDLRVEGTSRQGAPASTTQSEVAAARDALNARPSDDEIELIREGEKKVTLQIEKVVSERLVALTKPLLEAVPILEPLVQTFVEAADRTLQERIAKSYDRALQVARQNPTELDAAIDREARAIVAATNTTARAEHAAPRAQQQAEQLRQTLSALAEGKLAIDTAVAEHLARQSKPDPWADGRTLSPLPELYRFALPDLYPSHPSPYTYQHRLPSTDGLGQGRLAPLRPVTPPRPAPRAPGRFFW